MSVFVRNLHPSFVTDKARLRRHARAILDSFHDGRHGTADAGIIFVTNASMRRLARRYTRKGRSTTDVLSFRLADETIASPMARRHVHHSWQHLLSNMSAAPYLNPRTGLIETHTSVSQADIPNELGTVLVAPDFCRRVADSLAIPPAHYLLLAIVHGLAHLSGHTHSRDDDTVAMLRAEQHALSTLHTLSENPSSSNLLHPSSYLRMHADLTSA